MVQEIEMSNVRQRNQQEGGHFMAEPNWFPHNHEWSEHDYEQTKPVTHYVSCHESTALGCCTIDGYDCCCPHFWCACLCPCLAVKNMFVQLTGEPGKYWLPMGIFLVCAIICAIIVGPIMAESTDGGIAVGILFYVFVLLFVLTNILARKALGEEMKFENPLYQYWGFFGCCKTGNACDMCCHAIFSFCAFCTCFCCVMTNIAQTFTVMRYVAYNSNSGGKQVGEAVQAV